MKHFFFSILLTSVSACAWALSHEQLLLDGWRFHRGAADGAEQTTYDDSNWQKVSIPHDWAIAGPFDKDIDKQVVAIEQNGEKVPTEKTGRPATRPFWAFVSVTPFCANSSAAERPVSCRRFQRSGGASTW